MVHVGTCCILSSGDLFRKHGIKNIIHAVGPHYNKEKLKENNDLLSKCIQNSILKANEHKLKSIAIPAISSGIFGYPKKACAIVLLETIKQYMLTDKEKITRLIKLTNNDEITCKEILEQDNHIITLEPPKL